MTPSLMVGIFLRAEGAMSDPPREVPGGPAAGTAGLGCPVQAVTIRGHSLYVNAPSSLRKKCRVPLGSPSIETTLTGLPRLGTDLGSPKWPCRTLTPHRPLPPVPETEEGISQESRPLLGHFRGAQGTRQGPEIFSPRLLPCVEKEG